jgi:hypothetical protein
MINSHVTAPLKNYQITIDELYLARDIKILMRATSIKRAIGRGGGP